MSDGNVNFIIDDIKVVERFFQLPLDHSNPDGETIQVFARNLIPKSKAKSKEEEEKLPYCKLDATCHETEHLC